jgi:hypothetical protein
MINRYFGMPQTKNFYFPGISICVAGTDPRKLSVACFVFLGNSSPPSLHDVIVELEDRYEGGRDQYSKKGVHAHGVRRAAQPYLESFDPNHEGSTYPICPSARENSTALGILTVSRIDFGAAWWTTARRKLATVLNGA